MFTIETAKELLHLAKKVEQTGVLLEFLNLTQPYPFQLKYTLVAVDNFDLTFIYEINQSAKNHYKFTLYLMDEDTRIGLIRVDFNGQHQNPETIIDKVPVEFHPFAGKFFTYNEHHIHYYIEGYKTTLDWAMPLTDDNFPVKQITGNNDVLQAFYSFNEIINLETKFNINPLLI